MALVPRPFPTALPHGELREVMPGIHFVTGTMKMGGPLRFSRNMTVVREGDRLMLRSATTWGLRVRDGASLRDALGAHGITVR